MFFTDSELYSRIGVVPEEQLTAAPLTRRRLQAAEVIGTRTVYAASSCRREIAGVSEGARWLAVGDSAASYDPLSGLGIFRALRGGTNAAIAVDGYLRGETQLLAQYAALIRNEWDAYVLRRRAHYAAETCWAGEEFWVNRTALRPVGA